MLVYSTTLVLPVSSLFLQEFTLMRNLLCVFFFFFTQKTAYELRIIDWSSDVCSSDLLRVALLGKSGSITAQLKSLGALPGDQRKAAGEAINRARDAIGAALSARKAGLEDAALDARLATETIDITLPGRDAARGGLHPVSRTVERIADIFGRLGYELSDGPEIEDAWHNFEALNFPPHHPESGRAHV